VVKRAGKVPKEKKEERIGEPGWPYENAVLDWYYSQRERTDGNREERQTRGIKGGAKAVLGMGGRGKKTTGFDHEEMKRGKRMRKYGGADNGGRNVSN